MSAQPETTYYRGLLKFLPDVYSEKMNNPYSAGTPDLYFSGRFTDLWLEVKYIRVPKNPATLVKYQLTPRQQKWLRDRHIEGRRVAVLVGSPEGGLLMFGRAWETEIPAIDFRQLAQGREHIAAVLRDFIGSSPCRSSSPSSRRRPPSAGSTA